MATQTYDPIASITLSALASSVTFSAIPQTYTDLVISASTTVTADNGQATNLQFNSDTGSNYSSTVLYGNGTSALSARQTNATYANAYNNSSTSGEWNANIINIMNYSNTTTNKIFVSRGSSTIYPLTYAGLWRSTAAINTIKLLITTGNFNIGSTFNLYGIKAGNA